MLPHSKLVPHAQSHPLHWGQDRDPKKAATTPNTVAPHKEASLNHFQGLAPSWHKADYRCAAPYPTKAASRQESTHPPVPRHLNPAENSIEPKSDRPR